ncbi:formin-binding protein 1-like isoform X2 [Centruroides vittatus]|uniref:formin-binding protein 1-like isoform X2 n=1 Tax=Centruroides vittatus TaxID=120091 RepID=UPI003510570E
MSWGVDLWDQYDNLSIHTHRGIDFLDKYGQFVKERCSIEHEYAYKLKKLIKNHLPKKINEDEYYKLSSCQAFMQMTKEINDLAGQHELIAENLTTSVVKEITVLVKEMKDERKKYLHEGAKLQNTLQNSIAQLEKAKKIYEKAFKEAEKAQDNYIRADADINLSRAEVEKAKSLATMKSQLCEVTKNDYADHLQKTNEWQKLHYSDYLPKLFQQLQDMEERRIACIQNYMKQSADVHKRVLPIINKCLDGMIDSAESINPKNDSEMVSDMYKTGLSPPEDIPFEDLSNMKISDQTGNGHAIQYNKTDTIKGTVSAGKLKKRGGIFGIFSLNKNNIDECKEDCSDLPPNQRKKKLQQKIDNLNLQIQQETGARDALMRMKEVYEQNPSMGNPLTIEGQLAENGHNLERLRLELQKYQGYLNEADGKTPPVQRRHRSSLSEDSLSRSASDSSVSNPYVNSNNNRNHNPDATTLTTHGSSNSPESGIGMSRASLPDEEEEEDEFDDYGNEFDSEPLPVIGTARAIYAFDSQSDGSISIYEGEEFEVVELDQGDGWTRVRKSNLDEGFVPTSYIEVFVYNNC